MKKTISLLVALAAVLLVGTSTFSNAAEPYVSNMAVETLSSGSAVAAYWTPERMQNAKPYPIPTLPGSPQPSPATLQRVPAGEPGVAPGHAPRGSALLSGDESAIHALAGGTQTAEPAQTEGSSQLLAAGYDYPPPHTTYLVYNKLYGLTSSPYPYKAIGRVFFRDASGTNYACSGSSIGGRAVLTAGHCVYDNGSWHTNWVFIPNYKRIGVSYNTWAATQLWTFTGWLLNRDFGRDVGFALTAKKGTRTLSSRVGSLGLAWNLSSPQHWTMFGYPAQSPYDGKSMVETDASFSSADASFTPNPFGMGSAQTGGCSGGPRLVNFAPGVAGGDKNLVNGVISYYYPAQPGEIFSPYFDDTVHGLYASVIAQ